MSGRAASWRRARAVALAMLPLAAALPAGCGGDGDGAGEDALVVSAATSLTVAFERYGAGRAGEERFQFAGSDALAAQVRQGVRPDVVAFADTALPAALHRERLVEAPVPFAANRLAIVTAAGDGAVAALADLARPGTTVALGSPTVPVGAYARAAIARLGRERGAAILANVRSEEPDVAGVVGKVAQGAVDAGIVYATDAAAAGGRLRGIPLPERVQPRVTYAAAVVRGARHPRAARAFVAGLRRGAGAVALEATGFSPPPARGAPGASRASAREPAGRGPGGEPRR